MKPSALKNSTKVLPVASISQLLGLKRTLPGEDEAQYQASLQALLSELEAKSVLQVYLAEKIHESLWWIRRYEQQKRASLIADMAALTRPDLEVEESRQYVHVRDSLLAGRIDEAVEEAVARKRQTLESLRQKAFTRKSQALSVLDSQIALQVKILTNLQATYEVVTGRKLQMERMILHNEMLRCDLKTVDVPLQEVTGNGQRKPPRRKPA